MVKSLRPHFFSEKSVNYRLQVWADEKFFA